MGYAVKIVCRASCAVFTFRGWRDCFVLPVIRLLAGFAAFRLRWRAIHRGMVWYRSMPIASAHNGASVSSQARASAQASALPCRVSQWACSITAATSWLIGYSSKVVLICILVFIAQMIKNICKPSNGLDLQPIGKCPRGEAGGHSVRLLPTH